MTSPTDTTATSIELQVPNAATIKSQTTTAATTGPQAPNESYDEVPFYYNAHKKDPADRAAKRTVAINPVYNHLFSIKRKKKNAKTDEKKEESKLDSATSTTSVGSRSLPLIVVIVLCIVAGISLVLAIGAISVARTSSTSMSSAEEVKSLKIELQKLQDQLVLSQQILEENQTRLVTNQSLIQINDLREEVEQLRTQQETSQQELEESQTRLQTSVTEQSLTQNVQVNSLRDELEQLRTQQETNQIEVRENQTMLQSSVNTLTDRLNSSVNFLDNCFEEVETCYSNPQSGRYKRQCNTSQVQIKIPGHFTLSIRCEYSSDTLLLQSAYLRPSDNFIQCICDVTNPLEDSPGHAVIPDNLAFLCVLVITRCPL